MEVVKVLDDDVLVNEVLVPRRPPLALEIV